MKEKPIKRRITGLHAILLPLILIGANESGTNPVTADLPDPPQTDTRPAFVARPVKDLIEAQIALSRQSISCGPVDGLYGPQTQSALRAFQRRHNLRVHGDLDNATREQLVLARPAMTTITVSSEDLEALHPVPSTWLGKSEVAYLGFESILERVAEYGHASPHLIRTLNAGLDWEAISPGTVLTVPDTRREGATGRAAMILIHLAGRTLQAYDENGRLLMHFPCSIARKVSKRPVGKIEVSNVITNPNYTFDPDVFPESAEARRLARKLIIPPGPNNPVGVAWIGLNLPGYGIHGTPLPGKVGRTESHGCFRLANWNVTTLIQVSWIGLPVYVEP